MTTNENPQDQDQDIHLSPLMADIFTGMFAQSEATTNQVFDNYERDIREWKERFLNLWELLEKENQSVDSLKIEVILNRFSYFAGLAAQDLDSH